MLPVSFGVGLAIDLSSITRERGELQRAVDGAVLMVARQGLNIDMARARQIAADFLQANATLSSTQLSVSRTDLSYTVAAAADAETYFGGLIGYDAIRLNVAATAELRAEAFEIGLTLDTTGSMAGGKLTAMKEAVANLVDTMSGNVTSKDRLKFAVVPFASFVNVGPHFAPRFDAKGKLVPRTGAEWLDLKGKSKVRQLELEPGLSRFELFRNLGVDWAGCVETREATKKIAYDVTDEPAGKKPESLFIPAFSIDEPSGYPYQNDYIASDADPLDKSGPGKVKKLKKYGVTALVDPDLGVLSAELAPVDATLTASRGPNAGCDTQPILPLTSDYQAVRQKVRSLEARGNTNITEGVAWGWRVLSPGEPFSEGAAKGKARKILILLTDGSNVLGVSPDPSNLLGSSYSSFGFVADERLVAASTATASGTNAAMNEKTLAACTNAKNDGIEIFTIRLEEPNKATGTLLQSCASSPAHYLDVPNREALDAAFKSIADSIVSIRLSS